MDGFVYSNGLHGYANKWRRAGADDDAAPPSLREPRAAASAAGVAASSATAAATAAASSPPQRGDVIAARRRSGDTDEGRGRGEAVRRPDPAQSRRQGPAAGVRGVRPDLRAHRAHGPLHRRPQRFVIKCSHRARRFKVRRLDVSLSIVSMKILRCY